MPGHTDEKTMMKMNKLLDPGSVAREGEMARENIPANMDMGMDSMMPQRMRDTGSVAREGEITAMPPSIMSVEQKIMALMDMGLTQGEAIDAIAMEESAGSINPNAFAGRRDPGSVAREAEMSAMGALGGVPANMPMPMPRGSTNMGMPEDAMVAQRMNQVDTSGMSPQQIEMLRMGRDPFAEGMMGR